MTATTLFILLLLMVLGIGLLIGVSFWYGWMLLKRQNEFFKNFLPYLKKMELEQQTIQSLHISDDTPLSQLENLHLPDNVQVDFQRRK